jgi:hypothetical protein
MRSILVGTMVAMVAVMAGPAFGEMSDDDLRARAENGGVVHFTNPAAQVVEEDYHSGAAEFGLALASTGLSLVYHPFRAVFGLIGAELGGFGGWATGGDLRTAKGLWRPTVEGDYYIRPDQLDGTEGFRFNGTTPIRERRTVTVREHVVSDAETVEAEPVESDSDNGTEPDEPL